jgi:hypothetical protein
MSRTVSRGQGQLLIKLGDFGAKETKSDRQTGRPDFERGEDFAKLLAGKEIGQLERKSLGLFDGRKEGRIHA